jgi:hypothetical protein
MIYIDKIKYGSLPLKSKELALKAKLLIDNNLVDIK